MAPSEPRPLPALNEPPPPPPRSPQRPACSRLPRLSPSRAKVTFCVRGVVSPVLANLYLHYAFDLWMGREFPNIPFERYADDVICHCGNEAQAVRLKDS